MACAHALLAPRSTTHERQAGTRILYWVRGCFRVRDNFALSVAMWLSRELQMPLHAVAFVDPAIGSVASSSNAFAGQQAQQKRQSPGVRGHDEIFSLSFRMAVEASALCEMEKSLRVGGGSSASCLAI